MPYSDPAKRRAADRRWGAKNREKRGASNRKWRAKNPEKKRAIDRRWCAKNPKVVMLIAARKHAKTLGLPCTLTVDDFCIPERCPVLGIPFRRGEGKRIKASPSLDRIDSAKGYVRGNVQVISWRANRLKHDATVDEIRALADYVNFHMDLLPT